MAIVTVFTDGSADNLDKKNGGYGIYMDRDGDVRMYSGGQYINTTSTRMEMMGALIALKKCEAGDTVSIFMDSQFVVNSFQQRWVFKWEKREWRDGTNNKPPFVGMRANYDLFKQMLIQYRRLDERVTFHWVRGHVGKAENEICDILANEGRRSDTILIDIDHENWRKR